MNIVRVEIVVFQAEKPHRCCSMDGAPLSPQKESARRGTHDVVGNDVAEFVRNVSDQIDDGVSFLCDDRRRVSEPRREIATLRLLAGN